VWPLAYLPMPMLARCGDGSIHLERRFDDLDNPPGNPHSVFWVHSLQTQREYHRHRSAQRGRLIGAIRIRDRFVDSASSHLGSHIFIEFFKMIEADAGPDAHCFYLISSAQYSPHLNCRPILAIDVK